MRKAERTIANLKAAYLKRTADVWEGRERELVIEMVRGLDEAAFAFQMAPNQAELRRTDSHRHLMLMGAAAGLRPFLEGLRNAPGGVPWGPTSRERAALADQHLANCGTFAYVQRVAELERFGLANATFIADDHLVLEAPSAAEEADELHAGLRLSEIARRPFREQQRRLAARKPYIAKLLDQYVYPVDGWFIGYDNTEELVAYHREFARIRATGIAEAEALPPDALLGGRPFSEWNEASVIAYGAVLQHIAFATRLGATTPGLQLRNLLTIFARKDDISAVWQERGEDTAWSSRLLAALTLEADSALKCERNHEIPLPYYIDFGRDFVLLPMFGGLMNPCAGLVWHVRSEFRPDWDRAVDGRKARFRDDLRSLFPAPRYVVPTKSAVLKRSDGSRLTDIDAMVLDRSTGELVLVQLKWPDLHGRSLAERNSRRLNLLKANEWVEKVAGWVDGRSAHDVGAHLGLEGAGGRPPVLLVLARHAARFTGEKGYDPRARWVSWPGFVQAYGRSPKAGIVSALRRPRSGTQGSTAPTVSTHQLPGLKVEVRVH
ncbi:hypothetical protein [Caulobacter sp. S45]|uniref:hypothetical protein n=1 Tax=Caulobacter sp. S45 TaxID=1641861 RepID=UPI0015772B5B|nr:hypothetical protein [Caulobacter sp. S45]